MAKQGFVPYRNAEQVYEEFLAHNGMVKDWQGYYALVGITDNTVTVANHHPGTFSLEEALNRFIWADGTPFGLSIS